MYSRMCEGQSVRSLLDPSWHVIQAVMASYLEVVLVFEPILQFRLHHHQLL